MLAIKYRVCDGGMLRLNCWSSMRTSVVGVAFELEQNVRMDGEVDGQAEVLAQIGVDRLAIARPCMRATAPRACTLRRGVNW